MLLIFSIYNLSQGFFVVLEINFGLSFTCTMYIYTREELFMWKCQTFAKKTKCRHRTRNWHLITSWKLIQITRLKKYFILINFLLCIFMLKCILQQWKKRKMWNYIFLVIVHWQWLKSRRKKFTDIKVNKKAASLNL